MSLHKLCRTGLLFEESYQILESLKKKLDWKYAEQNLFQNGLSPSKDRAYQIQNELKKRFLVEDGYFPSVEILREISQTKFKISTKKEILFVYLYNKDEHLAKMLHNLQEVGQKLDYSPIIHRKEIKQFLLDYQHSVGNKPKQKTIDNWVGRFISILQEVNILIKKEFNTYLINFGMVQPNTWNLFALQSHFHQLSLINSPLIRCYNLHATNLRKLFEFTNNNMLTYKLIKDPKNNINIKIETKYQNLLEWIHDHS